VSTDFIQVLMSAFSDAVNAAVDARVTALMQHHSNLISQIEADLGDINSTDNSLVTAIDALKQRVAALELRIPVASMTEVRVGQIVDEAVKREMKAHLTTYDHDEYDRIVEEVDDFDLDRLVNVDDLEREIKSALRNATVSIEV